MQVNDIITAKVSVNLKTPGARGPLATIRAGQVMWVSFMDTTRRVIKVQFAGFGCGGFDLTPAQFRQIFG